MGDYTIGPKCEFIDREKNKAWNRHYIELRIIFGISLRRRSIN